MNRYYLSENPNTAKTFTGIQAAIAHEQGHAFALAHNNSNPFSIMCQELHGRSVNVV